nr:hypothetical protein TetV2_00393 [Oceanusvirus sp.]
MNEPDIIERVVSERENAERERLSRGRKAAADVAGRLGLMVHGGTAISRLLPRVFDAKDVLPDVDTFSSKGKNSKKTAHAVAHMVSQEIGEDVRVVPAIHKATQSVRAGRNVLLDVSWVDPSILSVLKTVAKDEGTPADVAPVAYLKMSIHFELYRPNVYVQRWRKLWPRLCALYEEEPTVRGEGTTDSVPDSVDGEFEALPTLEKGFAVVGKHAVKAMTGSSLLADWPIDLVYSETDPDLHDAPSAVDRLCHELDCDYPPTKGKETLIVPQHYRLTKDGRYLARVFVIKTDVCTAIGDDGITYGSSDLVMHLLYSQYIKAPRPDDDARKRIATAIDLLYQKQKTGPCDAGITRRFRL